MLNHFAAARLIWINLCASVGLIVADVIQRTIAACIRLQIAYTNASYASYLWIDCPVSSGMGEGGWAGLLMFFVADLQNFAIRRTGLTSGLTPT